MRNNELNHYRASLTSVTDSDELGLVIDLGFRCGIHLYARLRGYVAPSMNGEHAVLGKMATEYLESVLHGRELSVRTYPSTPAVLHLPNQLTGKWLVDVTVDYSMDLVNHLVAMGWGKKWQHPAPRPTFSLEDPYPQPVHGEHVHLQIGGASSLYPNFPTHSHSDG